MKLSYHALSDQPNLVRVKNLETGLYFARFTLTIHCEDFSHEPIYYTEIQWTKQPEAVIVRGSKADVWFREHFSIVED